MTPRFCKSCEYDLGGIETGRCPECAREFDIADRRSFDTVPRRTRRRRRLTLIAIAVAIVGVAVVLFPRGYVRGQLTIRPPDAAAVRIIRVELVPPRWLSRLAGWRYPRWTREEAHDASLRPEQTVVFDAHIRSFRFRAADGGGSMSAWSDEPDPTMMTWINGIQVKSENARAIFDTMLPAMASGGGYGVTIGGQPPPPVPAETEP